MSMQLNFSVRGYLLKGLIGVMTVVCGASVLQAQFPTPEVTPEHKVLKKDVGVWTAEMKLWMSPGQEPMVCTGAERNRMLGGLWLLSDFTADMAGQEFHGHGQFGYDAKNKKYVGTWVDNLTTNISTMAGTYDKDKGEMTMLMTGVDPETGKEVKSKSVSKSPNKDSRVFTMYMQDPSGGDKWVKSMEITYKRRPGDGKRKHTR